MTEELQYLDLLSHILASGEDREDRTGTGTKSIFHAHLEFDLSDGTLPVITTKRVHLKSVIHELLWFLRGDRNISYLQENGVRIWDEWGSSSEDYPSFTPGTGVNVGNMYGAQWRAWGDSSPHDQIRNVIDGICANPTSRRHLVSAWNVADIENEKCALPPCHYAFQFYVSQPGTEDAALSCLVNMRSSDVFLGLPFNITSYALLTHMIAHLCGLGTGKLHMVLGDTHLYMNHLEQAKLQITREPLPFPKLKIARNVTDIDDFKYEDLEVVGYEHHPAIKGKVSV